MRVLYLFAILILTSTAFGATGSGNLGDRWTVQGYYGIGFVNPKDVNDSAAAQGTTPALGKISSDTIYGGKIGYMVSPKFRASVTYEMHDAKNPTNTTTPGVSGAGFELQQNEIWGSLDYFLHHNGSFYAYLGLSVGYPTYSHAIRTLAVKTDFDADKTIGFGGQLGAGFMLGKHFTLFAEGAYISLVSGTVKGSGGTVLTGPSGANAKIDLSGFRVVGGLGIVF